MTAQFTREQAVKALQGVEELHDKTADFFNSQGLEPKSDSPAAKELQAFKRPESLLTAYGQGTGLIEVAADHLIAVTKTLTEPAQTVAPWTTARVVLEASALSCWLLDTKITARVRVGRSLSFRYEGLIQQKKFVKAIGVKTDDVNLRIEEVEAMAESLGFAKLRSKKSGDRTGIGQIMPSVTEIIRDTLQEEANYRLFSAMAHAHHWAYTQLSFKKAGETAVMNNKVFFMEKHISLETVLWLCGVVARCLAQTIKHQCELFGWNTARLNIILDDAFHKIGIRPGSKLWHTR